MLADKLLSFEALVTLDSPTMKQKTKLDTIGRYSRQAPPNCKYNNAGYNFRHTT
jgi:hypothetical protein